MESQLKSVREQFQEESERKEAETEDTKKQLQAKIDELNEQLQASKTQVSKLSDNLQQHQKEQEETKLKMETSRYVTIIHACLYYALKYFVVLYNIM